MFKIISSVILSSFLVCAFSDLSAQTDNTRISAKEHVNYLKDGVLLIRLHTKQKSIDALMAADRISQAEQVKMKTEQENLALINAVRKNFTFCPVYYFFSYDSKYVADSQLDSVGFLNENLELDSTIVVNSANYYTAELGLIEQNTKDSYKNIREGEENNPNAKNEAKYYGGSNMRFHAFIIKDNSFNQLERPFPYYSRTMNSFFMKKTTDEVVERMNQKLFKFLLN